VDTGSALPIRLIKAGGAAESYHKTQVVTGQADGIFWFPISVGQINRSSTVVSINVTGTVLSML
jgi:hypothetical protein